MFKGTSQTYYQLLAAYDRIYAPKVCGWKTRERRFIL